MIKLLALIFLLPRFSSAQVLLFSGSEKFLATGSVSRNFVDVFAGMKNPACLAEIRKAMIGVSSEKKFMLKELGVFSAVGAINFCNGGFGLQLDYAGNKQYNEWKAGISYGLKCSEKLFIGIGFGFNHFGYTGYESAGGIAFQAGYLFYLTENLKFSCYAENLPASISKRKREMLCGSGLGYQFSEKVLFGVQLDKTENHSAEIFAFLHYAFNTRFFLKTSISFLQGQSFVGVGLKWHNISLLLAASYNMPLGASPLLSLSFEGLNKTPAE
jgi:hypothetical protein